jgi:hypothetical protein
MDAVPWGLRRLRRGRHLVGRHRHGREFNPLRALLGLIMDDQSTTFCPLPSLFLGPKIAVRQGHRTPKGTLLRGAVLHCQFEREAKGGPPQHAKHQALPDAWVQRNESRGLVGPVFAHESVGFSRPTMLPGSMVLLSNRSIWYRTNSAACLLASYHGS